MAKILLVEDDKSLREIYGVRLLAEGYDIVSAGDGEEALAMAIKERPALIVSDVMMPKISGFDMLDILRSTTETRDVKVIMMTALSSEDQRQRGEQLGADRYLVKSQVGIEDVVKAVHDVLNDAPGSSPVSSQPAAPAPQTPTTAPTPQATPQMPTSTLPQLPTRPSVDDLSPNRAAAPMPTSPAASATPQASANAGLPVPAPQTPTAAPTPQATPQMPSAELPEPNTPSTPAPQMQHTYTSNPPQNQTTQSTEQPSTSLPQPTAPFSSSAPRPNNLGERVIHPLEPIETSSPDLSKLMEQELSDTLNLPSMDSTAGMTPQTPTAAPTPQATPQMPSAGLPEPNTPSAPAPQIESPAVNAQAEQNSAATVSSAPETNPASQFNMPEFIQTPVSAPNSNEGSQPPQPQQ